MKGIIFNLLEEAVSEKYGPTPWDDLIDAAGLKGAYTSVGNYPDAEVFKLVEAASAALKQPPEAIVRWFGRAAIPLLAKRYPAFFEPHATTRAFLMTLDDIIHVEVRKIYSGAETPRFDFESAPDGRLVMIYSSRRKMCVLAEGLIEGAADHFRETVTIQQLECMNRGDAKCRLACTFRKT